MKGLRSQREQHNGERGALKTKKPQRRRGWCVKNKEKEWQRNKTGNMGTGWDHSYSSMIHFFLSLIIYCFNQHWTG